MTESQTVKSPRVVRVWTVSCRELEDRCWMCSGEAKRSQMGQTLFDELSLSEFKARLGREGGGLFGALGLGRENYVASDGTITECSKSKFRHD